MNPARSRFWWQSLGAPALTRAGHQGVSLEDGTVQLPDGGQADGLSQSGLLSLDLYQP
jgi:hypothetical protein